MKRNISDGRKIMKILDFFKNLFVKKPEFDRNYHHYVMTDHCRTRMKERRILYKDINLCMKYGVLVGNQIVLDEIDIPKTHWESLNPSQTKHVKNHLPLVVTIKEGTKIITTVYKGNNSIKKKRE